MNTELQTTELQTLAQKLEELEELDLTPNQFQELFIDNSSSDNSQFVEYLKYFYNNGETSPKNLASILKSVALMS